MKGGKARKKKPTYCGRHGHGHGSRRAKIRYRSLKDAKGARSSLMAHTGLEIRIYGCQTCGGYHLTSEPDHAWGNNHTVWQTPVRTISSQMGPDGTEEKRYG